MTDLVGFATEWSSWWLGVLLRQSLYATLIFALVLTISLAWKSAGPRWRSALWLLVLIRLLLPPDLSHPFALRTWLTSPETARAGELSPSAASPHHSLDRRPEASLSSTAAPWPGEWPWEMALSALWLTGAVFTWRRSRAATEPWLAMARSASPVSDLEISSAVAAWKQRLGIRREVETRVTQERVSPFTVGVLQPIIVLPASWTGQTAIAQPAIGHEMEHIRRFDALRLLVEHILLSVYFFHPLVRFTLAQLDLERERLCDQAVLDAGAMTPRDYAGSLLDALGLGWNGGGALTLLSGRRRIERRLRSILAHRPGHGSRPWPARAVILIGGSLVLPLAPAQVESAAPVSHVWEVAATESPSVKRLVMIHPLPDARVAAPWGPMKDPFDGRKRHHDGIDLAAPEGRAVLAAAAGKVVTARSNYGDDPHGRFIVIAHENDLTTFYGHLGDLHVQSGERVEAGQKIATVGMTGRTTGPHLHFEVRQGGVVQSLDPELFLADRYR